MKIIYISIFFALLSSVEIKGSVIGVVGSPYKDSDLDQRLHRVCAVYDKNNDGELDERDYASFGTHLATAEGVDSNHGDLNACQKIPLYMWETGFSLQSNDSMSLGECVARFRSMLAKGTLADVITKYSHYMFDCADVNKTGTMHFKEFFDLYRSANPSYPEWAIIRAFEAITTDSVVVENISRNEFASAWVKYMSDPNITNAEFPLNV